LEGEYTTILNVVVRGEDVLQLKCGIKRGPHLSKVHRINPHAYARKKMQID